MSIMSMNRSAGLFIPPHIWGAKTLTMKERLVLTLIEMNMNSDGYCNKPDREFAEIMGMSREGISKIINSIARKGVICKQVTRKDFEHTERKIFLNY